MPLDSHIKVVKGPLTQVVHAFVAAAVSIDERFKTAPLFEQMVPVSQLVFSSNDQEGPRQLILADQNLEEVHKSDSLSETLLVSQDHVCIAQECFFKLAQAFELQLVHF